MADRASASILIGGTIPDGHLKAMLEAIALDHGRLDWEGEPVEEDNITPGTSLEIFTYDLPGGIFENVESFCREHSLFYRRSSATCAGAFGRERVIFDGCLPPRHYELNESDQIVLTWREPTASNRSTQQTIGSAVPSLPHQRWSSNAPLKRARIQDDRHRSGLRSVGEHPRYPIAAWKAEVADDNTRLGYWAWVAAQSEAETIQQPKRLN